jgi:hypothetical protein
MYYLTHNLVLILYVLYGKTKLMPLFFGDIGHMLYRRLMDQWISLVWWYLTETVILTVFNTYKIHHLQSEKCTYFRMLLAV